MLKKLLFASILLHLTSCSLKEQADLIVYNAKIYTVDEAFSVAECMAVKDGKILAVGKTNEVLNKYDAKDRYNAGGSAIYPGFIDAHCHFYGYGLSLRQVNLTGTKSFEEVVEKIKLFAEETGAEWITGRGWDQNDWAVKEFPDRRILDSLFPERPVFVQRIDGHAALANSEALKRAGINEKSKIEGGIIEIKNGRLTGILIDNAVDEVNNIIPKPPAEEVKEALLAAQQNCFKAGLTTVDDAGLDKNIVDIIDSLQQAGALKMRVYAMLSPSKENFDHYLDKGIYQTNFLTVRSFKFYADGALGSRGAMLLAPYSDDPGNYGLLLNDTSFLRKNAERLYEKGFQINTHCIGDSAAQIMLTIYGDILKGSNDKRWRIEHCQVVHPDDLEKFARYNVIPSVQPTHATSDMYWAEERLGPERIKTAYAYKDLLSQNGLIALGSDFPIESINPLLGFYAAVARKDVKGFPDKGFQPKNALTREQALKGFTIWAAISNFEEKTKGSLEPGKVADFVVLEQDIMKAPLKEIPDIKVKNTFLNGEKVF